MTAPERALDADLGLALDPVEFARSVGIEPDDWQADLLRSDSKRVLINAARQSGKSLTCATIALHRALFFPASLVLVLAPALRQSQELFTKLSELHGVLGMPLKKYGERRLSLELINGSRVVTLPGTEKTIRGYSGAALLLVDEASRVDDSLYYAIRPMLAVSGGTLIMLSTPYGKRGAFYEGWVGGHEWSRYEVPADRCPRISPAFLAAEKHSLPERIYRQEYFCSFEDTEDQVFASADVHRAFDNEDIKPLALGRIF